MVQIDQTEFAYGGVDVIEGGELSAETHLATHLTFGQCFSDGEVPDSTFMSLDDPSVEPGQLFPWLCVQLHPKALLDFPAEPANAPENTDHRNQEGLLGTEVSAFAELMSEVNFHLHPISV